LNKTAPKTNDEKLNDFALACYLGLVFNHKYFHKSNILGCSLGKLKIRAPTSQMLR